MVGIISVICGFFYKFLIKPIKHEISNIEANKEMAEQYEEERKLMMSGLFACLDGLHQLGANGNVTKMREKLIDYNINRD